MRHYSRPAMLPPKVLPKCNGLLLSLDEKTAVKLSKQILDALPKSILDKDKLIALSESLSISEKEVTELIDWLTVLWRFTAYHQLKLDELQAKYEESGLPSSLSSSFIALWSSEGRRIIDRLGKISHAPFPRVTDVQHEIAIGLESSKVTSPGVPELSLRLSTTHGEKVVHLSKDEVIRLHQETTRIQEAIDKTLE